jgi:hypothetical protein
VGFESLLRYTRKDSKADVSRKTRKFLRSKHLDEFLSERKRLIILLLHKREKRERKERRVKKNKGAERERVS